MKKVIHKAALGLILFIVTPIVAQEAWVQKADFGGGKIYDAATFVIGNFAYVATGSNNAIYGKGLQRFMYRYNPSLDVWSRMADLPSAGDATFKAVGFAVGEKGYVCGGLTSAKIWEYDPVTNLWYQRINFPRAIEEGIGFAISTKAYIGLGGVNSIDYRNDFFEFDPTNNRCKQLNDFPGAPRRGGVGFSLDGKGYAGLGYKDIGSYNKGYYKDLWQYDPLTDEWTRLPDFPGEAREDAIAFGLDGAIYVGMGAINDFYKYDLKTKAWSTLKYMPGNSRVHAFSFCIGSGIYYGGGMSPNLTSDVWKYSPGISTSVTNKLEKEDFYCFPNPVAESFQLKGLQGRVKIDIVNSSGILVLSKEINGDEMVGVTHLPRGMYLVSVESENGIHRMKIMKR